MGKLLSALIGFYIFSMFGQLNAQIFDCCKLNSRVCRENELVFWVETRSISQASHVH